jgi:hypothetical protein
VNIYVQGGFVVSATSRTVDLLHGGELTVGAGSPPDPIDITVSDDGGAIGFTLASEFANKPSNYNVLLVPSDTANEPRFASITESHADIHDLAPGEYRMFLLKHGEEVEYRNPEVLNRLRSVTMTVRRGETTRVELKELAQ